MTDEPFLSRWSRRKSEAKAPPAPEDRAQANPSPVAAPGEAPAETRPSAPAAALPPLDSLSADSDFTAFMKPEVDPSLKRAAFKKLIEDPRYNVMDGLDVYIDDYSKPDPLPEGWLEKLSAVRYLGIFKEAPDGEAAAAEPALAAPEGAMPPAADPALVPPEGAMPPVAGAFPPPPDPADTAEARIPPPDVGKGADMAGGS